MVSFFFSIFFRNFFFNKTLLGKIGLEIFSILLTIAVFYYASESFSFKKQMALEETTSSLLIFLLVGEITLVFPMSFAGKLLTHFIELRNQQFYQTLIGLRISPQYFAFSRALTDGVFPFLRTMMTIIICKYFFYINISFFALVNFVFLQLVALVIFGLIALITIEAYLYFNRGIGLFYTLQSLTAIVAGAYFPVNVFPQYLKDVSAWIPQTQILSIARSIFNEQLISPAKYLPLLYWIFILSFIYFMLEKTLTKWKKQRGKFF